MFGVAWYWNLFLAKYSGLLVYSTEMDNFSVADNGAFLHSLSAQNDASKRKMQELIRAVTDEMKRIGKEIIDEIIKNAN